MESNIKIDAEFGSEFQETTAKQSLQALLHGWKLGVMSRHNKNKVNVEIKFKEPK